MASGSCLVGLVMIEHHHVKAERARLRQGLDAHRAAIDRDQKRRAALREIADRIDVRSVALEDTVGNMQQRIEAAGAQIARQQRRGGRAVHIVVAEDRHASRRAVTASRDPRRGLLHRRQDIRVRHQVPDSRIEIGLHRVRLHAPPRQHPRQQFGHRMALGDGERLRAAALVQPVAPGAAAGGTLDAQERTPLRPVVARAGIAVMSDSNSGIADARNVARTTSRPAPVQIRARPCGPDGVSAVSHLGMDAQKLGDRIRHAPAEAAFGRDGKIADDPLGRRKPRRVPATPSVWCTRPRHSSVSGFSRSPWRAAQNSRRRSGRAAPAYGSARSAARSPAESRFAMSTMSPMSVGSTTCLWLESP